VKIDLANGAGCEVSHASHNACRVKIGKLIGAGAISAVLAVLGGCATPIATAKAPTGDLQLTYAMPQAQGEQIPYRVFIPSTWRADRQWPLVVVLHGYAANANTPFVEAEGELQRQTERHGFVLVAPNGYNGMADYGANLPLPSLLSRMDKPLQMKAEQESALAEADVLNVVERVSRDYNVDARRVYLLGNSMGMTGTLHLAAKMPEKWCAISSSDGPPWPN
jgi:predicted peptidase